MPDELIPPPPPRPVQVAVWIVGLQAAALAVTALALLVATLVGNPHKLWIALSEVALVLLAAAVLALCGRGLLHARPSARTPVVLIELLCLPVGYSLGIQAGKTLIGVPILASAIVVLVLLFSPQARSELDRTR